MSTTLVTGATGKVGRRVVRRLRAEGMAHRAASRRGEHRLDLTDESTWSAALAGASTVMIIPPDDAEVEVIGRFAASAVDHGAEHLIMLSARTLVDDGPSEMERAVATTGAGTTFLQPTWFFDNWVEFPLFTEELRHGRLVLPTGDGREALIATDDIAAVAVAAIRQGPLGPLDLSGPAGEVFADVPVRLAAALGRDLVVEQVDDAGYRRHLDSRDDLDPNGNAFIAELMQRIAAGTDAHVATTVPAVLGRPARSMTDWIATVPDDAWPG